MYYFYILKTFLKFSGDENWNIGLMWINYALTPLKPEQEKPMLKECLWVLISR